MDFPAKVQRSRTQCVRATTWTRCFPGRLPSVRRLWVRGVPGLGRGVSARCNDLGSLEKTDQFLVGESVPVLWESGETAALVLAFEAEPALGILAKVIFSGGFRVDGRLRHRPDFPLRPILVDHVADCHLPFLPIQILLQSACWNPRHRT